MTPQLLASPYPARLQEWLDFLEQPMKVHTKECRSLTHSRPFQKTGFLAEAIVVVTIWTGSLSGGKSRSGV